MPTADLRPFRIAVPQSEIDAIKAKLHMPEGFVAPADDADWHYGIDGAYFADFLRYWREEYDWPAEQARLNRFEQFHAAVDGIDIHFFRLKAAASARPPIIMSHGWPGTSAEYLDAAARLAWPEQFGGAAEDGFDVILPSLPGYAFSAKSPLPLGPSQVASMWRRLMTEILDYTRFGAQGGDWGAAVTRWLGHEHGDVVTGIHLNMLFAPEASDRDDAETRTWRADMRLLRTRESAYSDLQATKPATIGLALAASPVAFAAWVLEKFERWGDVSMPLDQRFARQDLVTNIMLYLVNHAVASSLWPYYGVRRDRLIAEKIEVPTACALFPHEFMLHPPRQAVERAFNVARWSELPAGGHFPALELPEAFARDVGAFFRSLPQA